MGLGSSTLAIGGCAFALTVAGCGGSDRMASDQSVPADLASALAARSDDVAAKLAASHPCAALAVARTLRRTTSVAVAAGRLQPAIATELLRAESSLVARIDCSPPPPETVAVTQQPDQGKGHGKRAKGHEKHKHHEGGNE
jgi:hypothetical protein